MGYIYGFTHPLAPDRIKIGVTGSDPHVNIASNRESRASKLNAGLMVFGLGNVVDAFPPIHVEISQELDKALKDSLSKYQVPKGERGSLGEVYRITSVEALQIIVQVIEEFVPNAQTH